MARTPQIKFLLCAPENSSTQQPISKGDLELLQLEKIHQPNSRVRRLIAQRIEAYLKGSKQFCDRSPDCLLKISRCIDEKLFRDAKATVDYCDLSTLQVRVNAVLSSMSFRSHIDSCISSTVSPMADATASPTSLPLAGRVAIITGALRSIGRAIAVHLSSLGASVVAGYTCRTADAEALAAALPRAVVVRADVADEAAVRALFNAAESAFPGASTPPHILVACAGVMASCAPLAATSASDFDAMHAVNTRGAFLCLREAANRLRRGGGGRIVAVTSSATTSLPPGFTAYAGTKAAVEVMVCGLAKELKGTRVTANCVAVSPVATDMFLAGDSAKRVRRAMEVNPMGRLGEVDDVAPVVGFLCTDAAECVNGQVIKVNGGYVS